MSKYLLATLIGMALVGLVGSVQAFDTVNYWGNLSTPVDSNWHNDSNWAYGIPNTVHFASIRSERGYEEHVTRRPL